MVDVELLEVADGRPCRPALRYAEQGHDFLAAEGHRDTGQPLVDGSLGCGTLLERPASGGTPAAGKAPGSTGT
ncbi:hypothetical protein [Streptomyces jumonjinensis]|uniref:hypothetical protein n=1 Tax=Streptomyces jumonjinensis TaxID=1945 RepID=UPI00378D90EE